MEKKIEKYCYHQIQNELLGVMANTITRNIANEAKYFSLMADEVTDVSNREQVVCMCWVNGEL